jgi:uroporphyrinogen-III decarboxylase
MPSDVFSPKERLARKLRGEGAERAPVICPGGMMNAAVVEVMERTGHTLPEGHSDAGAMAALARGVSRLTGFENYGVPFCMTVEAEALGSDIDLGSLNCEPKIARERYASVSGASVAPPGGGPPDSAAPDSALPDLALSGSVRLGAGLSNVGRPGARLFGAGRPGAAASGIGRPEARESGAAMPDSATPDLALSGSVLPGAVLSNVGRPGARLSSAGRPEAALPGARIGVVASAVRQLAGGDIPVIGSVTGPVSTSASLVDPMTFLKELRKDRENAHRLLSAVTDWLIAYALALCEAGADAISIADPTATGEILGPRLFEEYALPYIGRLAAAIRRTGTPAIIHICGQIAPVRQHVARLGGNAVSTDAMVSLRALKNEYGHLTTMGNLSTIMLERGDPAGIERGAEALLRDGIDILAPACGLGTATPLANIEAFTARAKEG